MKIDIITLFPKLFESVFSESLISRAQKQKITTIKIHNLRDWSTDKYKTVDDKPFGGGPGMVLKVDVVDRALQSLPAGHKILLTPQGQPFSQPLAKKLAKQKQLILICGHYEGFDERIRDLIDEEISIGDYVLTGGEIPAMVIVDTVVRLLPGVVGKAASLQEESFAAGQLEYPQYTRPEDYQGKTVPPVLLSGNHAEIKKWREQQSKIRTKTRRPDLVR
ncbi:tRNA (guanosine(37)-N1)-methyltransferase TrmD [Candidatus Beckwithbacteria bacterium CG_4_9_14_0_2_um_filter_47_11]|uniref:tRNA (guanine-N(1)-)-methyltransferase n=1 Tax=Candidatus Beckwithbacteria bacterium CG_4_9_14_0_2_um_filter_47_11 TaxID=1974494 RepID=A0A2M8G379_9BACT|nr:MAG: tRNA (guanosine(37)-N1)-methyltransferase TrmD [Parcubacteria group bacterium CG10_big_fil_rev_8_21_14_0_10_41_35]PJC66108.1 MAG: tRNA (guanosine(37)-N1)-methyltransferase TrmD [Candidatus Beckwithbacteria bacterium CG_4_9_14_0_2_um_filter_47_11]